MPENIVPLRIRHYVYVRQPPTGCLLYTSEGVDAIQTVRTLAGPTNGRLAAPGTIRGDYSMSFQENIVHASDSPETAAIELTRFFKPEEIVDYKQATFDYLYANDEY